MKRMDRIAQFLLIYNNLNHCLRNNSTKDQGRTPGLRSRQAVAGPRWLQQSEDLFGAHQRELFLSAAMCC
ncbi:hypothetical protein BRAS3843_140011 [Bradyrhizobium sp. STM 3843]|nr:hypothetical protein BRAS3843_140011 [Bradyrhizobium sp. STM 3843]